MALDPRLFACFCFFGVQGLASFRGLAIAALRCLRASSDRADLRCATGLGAGRGVRNLDQEDRPSQPSPAPAISSKRKTDYTMMNE